MERFWTSFWTPEVEGSHLVAAGVRPTQILAAINQDSPGCLASKKTIYNEVKIARHEFLAGRRPVEALLDVLKDWPYPYF